MASPMPYATLFSYVMFLCFYTPCIATIVMIKKEIGWKYMFIHLIGALLISYCLSLLTFTILGGIEKVINPNFNANNIYLYIIGLSVLLVTLSLLGLPYFAYYLNLKFNKNFPINKIKYCLNWIVGFSSLIGVLFLLLFIFL